MKQSLRAKRMAKNNRRLEQVPKLNLTSMMDIFTILVFFLMVNSAEVQVIQSDKTIQLPKSTAEKKPRDTLVVVVSATDVLVQGRKVVDVAQLSKREDLIIAELRDELKYQAGRTPALTEEERQVGRAVTIMGDEKVPYKLLKRVMATCADTEYTNMSLAVDKRQGGPAAGQEG